jgi:membrane-associated phospholipid phosphatase
MLIILLLVNPYIFGVNSIGANTTLILLIFLSTFLIPTVAIVTMKFLGLISSFGLKDRHERIGPYIITGVLYLWIFRNVLDNPNIPHPYKVFVLGATLGLFIAFFINLFSKISAHAVGMGGLVGMLILTVSFYSYSSFVVSFGTSGIELKTYSLLMIAIVLSGIVCTSRLFLEAHNIYDLSGGFVVGLCAQFIALPFITIFL